MPFPIKASSHGQVWEIKAPIAGPTLLDFLYSSEVPIRSSCMGKGICHQCRVKVVNGIAPIAGSDRKAFSESALKEGWRLSCQMRPKAKLEVEFPQVYQVGEHLEVTRKPVSDWWLAVDLGTTGIEIAALDEQGEWGRMRALNAQVIMGADVMTRLEYAQRLGVEPLHHRLMRQLKKLLPIIEKSASNFKYLKQAYFAGNSVMTSFLHEWDIEQLAVSPYQPVQLEGQTRQLDNWGECHTLPLLNSFVGGDLWAGLFYLWQKGEHHNPGWILMDVGTNSEIIFWTGTQLIISSTPAGPAFEGSNISIGMRAEVGAIINPTYSSAKKWEFSVVGGDHPRGICGSALIQAIAQAVENDLLSIDGEIVGGDKLPLHADLALSQADVREFQLAKSAIKTGLDLVVKVSEQKANRLILAGSFGEHLPQQSAFAVGLLPQMKVETIGNSSLKGTIAWGQASNKERQEFQKWIEQYKNPVDLALRDDFQEMFIAAMNLQAY